MSSSPQNRTLKEMDIWEQPREKAEKYGYHTLSKSELLALILRTGVTGYPITRITADLLTANEDSLHRLMRRSIEEMQLTAGLGKVKAGQVKAIMELIKRYEEEETDPRNIIIRSSGDIYKLMRFELGNLSKEEIWLLSLNRRHAVISRHRITIGSSVASVFDLKAVLKKALLDEAEGIVLCHNHPSGNKRPSPQDDALTRSLKNAATTIEINLLDHVIVTSEGYYSYADEGRL